MNTLLDGDASGQSVETQTQGAPAAGSASASTAPSAPGSWRDSLPADLKDNPSLSSFTDIGGLAKSYVHAQSIVGKKGVVVPTDKDDDTVWGNFYKTLGVPDLDKYEITAPKDVKLNDSVMARFKESFQKNGVLPKQANAIIASYIQYEQDTLKEQNTKKEADSTAALEGLKREWGPEGFQKETAAARVAAKEIGPEFMEYLKQSGLANDPMLVKALAKFGKLYGEDRLRGEVGSGAMGKTKDDIHKEIQALESNPDYMDPMSKNFVVLNQRRESLYKQMFPS